MIPARVLFLFLSLLLFAPATALAQSEAPYSPKKTPIHELIVIERFESSPLSFPWELVSTDRVANRNRMDFELIYDIEFSEVREFLRQAYSEARDFVTLNPDALRFTEVTLLRMAGIELGDDYARITLGHPDLEPMFRAELYAEGRRTRVIVINTATTRQFSGFVPARVGFRPIGAEPIPFRWN